MEESWRADKRFGSNGHAWTLQSEVGNYSHQVMGIDEGGHIMAYRHLSLAGLEIQSQYSWEAMRCL